MNLYIYLFHYYIFIKGCLLVLKRMYKYLVIFEVLFIISPFIKLTDGSYPPVDHFAMG